MAKMYPPIVDEDAQLGEQYVYGVLRDSLPDDWVVVHDRWQFYRSRTQKHEIINNEADFFVIVPPLGMVTIEVKDWSQPVRIHGGEWQHVVKGQWKGMGKRKQTPLNQAHLVGKQTAKELRARKLVPSKFENRSLAILLKQVPENLADTKELDADIFRDCGDPAVETLYVCGDDALLNGLAERIRGLFVHRNDDVTGDIVRNIVGFLAPSMYFGIDTSAYRSMIRRATAPLKRLLPMLEESEGGILVEGCAGSGKTVMLCAEAARLAQRMEASAEGGRLLVLCFNRVLARELANHPLLREYTEGDEPTIFCSTLHSFCIDHVLESVGQRGLADFSGGDPLTTEALECVSRHIAPTYDAIFVDEAQDFKEAWWQRIVLPLLKARGRFYIFSDPHQRIFGEGNRIPPLPTRVRLTVNLRNVSQIARFASAMLPEGARTEALGIEGTGVILTRGSDDVHERAAIVQLCINDIREKYKAANRDIVVLSPWRSAKRDFCALSHLPLLAAPPTDRYEEGDELADRHSRCMEEDADKILGETIRAFKGMEAPFVILTDIPAPSESHKHYFTLNDLYVACTRASVGLYIVPTAQGEHELRLLMQQARHA